MKPYLTWRKSTIIPARHVLEGTDSFGDSGEVFNHMAYRNMFFCLWNYEKSRRALRRLAHNLLIRGKTDKTEHGGQCVDYTISLPPTDPKGERLPSHNIFIGYRDNLTLRVNYAKGDSNVPANALTPERVKCLLGPFIVDDFLSSRRFPAAAESNGYANMVRSFIDWSPKRLTQEGKDMGRLI